MGPTIEHCFLGDDAPVPDETTIVDLAVDGTLPAALSGQYVRIGPNPIERKGRLGPRPADGMVHGIVLHAGRASAYRNRWVKTVATSRRLGTEPVPGPRAASNDAATNDVMAFGGRLYALDDGALAYELDRQLETVRRVDLAGGGRGVGGHPKIDPATGELHLLSAPGGPSCQHHVISAGAHTRRSRSVDAPVGAVNDLAITEDHVVLVGDGVIGLTDRAAGARVVWCPVDVTAADRVVNAHDDGAAVVLEVTGRCLRRVVGDAAPRGVREHLLDRHRHVFGRIDARRVGLDHRSLYGLCSRGGRSPGEGTHLVKHDLASGDRSSQRFGPELRPGPFVLVNDPARAPQEDGGWLLVLVSHGGSQRSSLVVLDAADVAGPPLATVHIPRRVPTGRAATWLPPIA